MYWARLARKIEEGGGAHMRPDSGDDSTDDNDSACHKRRTGTEAKAMFKRT